MYSSANAEISDLSVPARGRRRTSPATCLRPSSPEEDLRAKSGSRVLALWLPSPRVEETFEASPFRHTRACRGYLAVSSADVSAGHSEIAATERGNDGLGDVQRPPRREDWIPILMSRVPCKSPGGSPCPAYTARSIISNSGRPFRPRLKRQTMSTCEPTSAAALPSLHPIDDQPSRSNLRWAPSAPTVLA